MLPAYIPIEVDANPEICDAITSRGKQAWILYRMKINPFYLERKTWKDRFRYWLRMTLVKWGLI